MCVTHERAIMDCLDEWQSLVTDPAEAITPAEWTVIGQTVAAASPDDRLYRIQLMAKHLYAQHGGSRTRWQAMILEMVLTVAKNEARKAGAVEGCDLALAAAVEARQMKRASVESASCPIRIIPATKSSKTRVQVQGQLSLFPKERA